MKKKFTFSVMVFLLCMTVTAWANAPVSLLVHQTSGSIYSAALQNVSKLSFDAGNLVIQAASAQKIPLAGIQKITFGASENTAVDNLLSNAACQAFVNNGILTVNAADGVDALQVVNLAGQVVFAGQYTGSQHLEIDAQSWAQGMYIVLMQTANGSTSAKIMLQ